MSYDNYHKRHYEVSLWDSPRQYGLKFAQLVNMAVAKFITEPQTIQLVPVNTKDFMATAEKAFTKHKSAMDKLK